jgi:hypothetical protein
MAVATSVSHSIVGIPMEARGQCVGNGIDRGRRNGNSTIFTAKGRFIELRKVRVGGNVPVSAKFSLVADIVEKVA